MTTETTERVATWRKVVAGVLFTIPWIFYLLLTLYDTAQPEFGGIPFFYWFQTLWLVVSSILFIIAVFILYPGRR